RDDANLPGAIEQLHSIYSRLAVDPAPPAMVETAQPKQEMPVPEPSPPPKPVDTLPVEANQQQEPEPDRIHSSLPMSNPKFRGIVEKFVVRLKDKMTDVDNAWNQRDYTELNRLGHWLKGSAGSMGFAEFIEPARELEQLAQHQDDSNLPQVIQQLHSINERLVTDAKPGAQADAGTSERASELRTEQQVPALKQVPTKSVDDDPVNNSEKIYSSLPTSNPKFHKIIEKFVVRLKDQMAALDSAWNERDYAELNRLGHWLKGSAGSLGFGEFIEPARELEQFASDQDDASLPGAIQALHSIHARLAIESKPKNPVVVEMINPAKEYVIPDKLTSRIYESKPRLRPIVGKFITQLSANCESVEQAVANEDFEEIEKFGYWLRASGGSVGFPAFTEPARDLENYAREKQLPDIRHTVSVIKQLNSRIVTAAGN
ncbi:MAG: Hpt domain-containing protein, partial [Gammaproteobacteria bacterium]|nr:Hpt domain-containing protein [Gammaproteobacteria bacterium]